MSKSAVGGVVRSGQVVRVIITDRWRMRYHVNPSRDERVIVVPGFRVQEPVPINEAGPLVKRVQDYVATIPAPSNACGECRLCCKLTFIKSDGMVKPSHTMCQYASDGGCRIYSARPKPCRKFECLWLKSQRLNDCMSPELRPDRCGVFFSDDTKAKPERDLIEIHVDRDCPGAMEATVVQEFMAAMIKFGKRFMLVTHYIGE